MNARNLVTWIACAIVGVPGVLTAEGDTVGSYLGLSWRIGASEFNRSIGSTHVDAGARTAESDVPVVSTVRRGPLADVGPVNAVVDRLYDNGHVGNDPAKMRSGLTYDWGVDNRASQIKGNSVTMSADYGVQSQDVTRQTGNPGGGSSETGSSSEWGHSLQVELGYHSSPTTMWSVMGAFSTLHSAREITQRSFSEEQTWVDVSQRVVDTFELKGGGLKTTPVTRKYLNTGSEEHRSLMENTVQQKVDFDLHTISLGVKHSQRWNRFEFNAAAGSTLNVIRVVSERNESVSVSLDGGPGSELRQWNESESGDKVLVGAFAQ
ncbi:MAG: hypothetical protein WCN95_16305, partial [bacterium]